MSAIPKKAIKFLELETISLAKLGIPAAKIEAQPDNAVATESKAKSIFGMLKSKVKASSTEKSKVQSIRDTRLRQYEIDVAAWLRFGLADSPRMVSLCVCYADAKGEFVEIVEEQSVEDGSNAMLSGRVVIKARGPISRLRVGCAGLQSDDRCYVEDITVSAPIVAQSKIA